MSDQKTMICDPCNGTGHIDRNTYVGDDECTFCDGHGKVDSIEISVTEYNALRFDSKCYRLLTEKQIDTAQAYIKAVDTHTAPPKREVKPKETYLTEGYIYLVRAITPDNHYKIGLSKEPVKRLEKMEIKLPFPIETIHLIPTDDIHSAKKTLHDKYANKRVNGEWFHLTPKDVNYIKSIKKIVWSE